MARNLKDALDPPLRADLAARGFITGPPRSLATRRSKIRLVTRPRSTPWRPAPRRWTYRKQVSRLPLECRSTDRAAAPLTPRLYSIASAQSEG